MHRNRYWLIAITTLLLSIIGFTFRAEAEGLGDPVLPDEPYNYANIELPIQLAFVIDNIPADNPITDEGATLGRVLFFDKRLSANDTIACATCHLQEDAFSDPRQFSVGFEGGVTRRNSMGLSNVRFFATNLFFWDTRTHSLEELALQPIQDELEMGSTFPELLNELAATSFYPDLFADAFGDPAITEDRIAKSIAQFLRSIVSYRSKYDQGFPDFNNFTALEEQGRVLFEATPGVRCNICHVPAAHVLLDARNNGLDLVYEDNGLGEITGDPLDDGKFKPPTLRNVGLTAPYMHDGRFKRLEDVIEHYSSGVQNHPNRDVFVPAGGFNFTQQQKDALVAFLHTLSDAEMVNDVRWSDPFVVPTSVGLNQATTSVDNSVLLLVGLLFLVTIAVRRKLRT